MLFFHLTPSVFSIYSYHVQGVQGNQDSLGSYSLSLFSFLKIIIFFWFDFRERERNIDLFYLFVHLLVAAYLCPDQASNPQPWCIQIML